MNVNMARDSQTLQKWKLWITQKINNLIRCNTTNACLLNRMYVLGSCCRCWQTYFWRNNLRNGKAEEWWITHSVYVAQVDKNLRQQNYCREIILTSLAFDKQHVLPRKKKYGRYLRWGVNMSVRQTGEVFLVATSWPNWNMIILILATNTLRTWFYKQE